ncbi:MAG: stage II sporulation protein R [Clostridia bacterium]|nr:stage II sporulation protein R [Clostridia bacterium]
MKRLEISILLALLFCAIVSFASFERECGDIRDNVLRLHILANSDTAEDQSLKLAVRDAILEASQDIFSGCGSIDEARAAARERLDAIREQAIEVIRALGYDYDVTVELSETYFSTREYDDITLPAGIYEAVQVRIGEAEGHNWWCVMFPMMCLPGSSESDSLSDVLSSGQMDIVQADGYEVRLRCVELYEQLCEYMRAE